MNKFKKRKTIIFFSTLLFALGACLVLFYSIKISPLKETFAIQAASLISPKNKITVGLHIDQIKKTKCCLSISGWLLVLSNIDEIHANQQNFHQIPFDDIKKITQKPTKQYMGETVSVILKSDHKYIKLPTQIISRTDVTEHFAVFSQQSDVVKYFGKVNKYKNSGFDSQSLIYFIPSGIYEIYLLSEKKNNNLLIKTSEKISL